MGVLAKIHTVRLRLVIINRNAPACQYRAPHIREFVLRWNCAGLWCVVIVYVSSTILHSVLCIAFQNCEKILNKGITGPEGHLLTRPEPVRRFFVCIKRLNVEISCQKSVNRWFATQKYYVHQTYFRETRKDTKVVCPVMWTYDIYAFDTGTYCDYYLQKRDILQPCKQNKHFRRITGNKYYTLLCHKEVT